LYPHYDFTKAVQGCARRLASLAPGAACVGFLAERAGCHVYRSLLQEEGRAIAEDIGVSPTDDGHCLVLRGFNTPPLYLCPGRQIVTAERLEVLCLTIDVEIEDGLPAETVVQRMCEVGGIPVLPWAVGKWLFRRGSVVRALLDRFGPETLLVGDSAMRPTLWPTPLPMRSAHRRGYRVLAGTDPLAVAGEEEVMGTYASLLDAEFDPKHARASLRSALRQPEVELRSVGARCGMVEFIQRMANARA
jgi:hypothetical protein